MPKKTTHVENFMSRAYGKCTIQDDITGFADLAISEANKILRGSVSLVINAIADTAKTNLISEVKGAKNTLPEGGALYKGIRAFVYKDKATGVVHVLGDTHTNDGTWRLRFFEAGTEPRYNRKLKGKTKTGKPRYTKGRFTGKIEPTWFFQKAIKAVEPNIISIMSGHIEKKITELAS